MRLTREKMVTFARSLRMGEDGDNSAKSLSLLLRHQSAMLSMRKQVSISNILGGVGVQGQVKGSG